MSDDIQSVVVTVYTDTETREYTIPGPRYLDIDVNTNREYGDFSSFYDTSWHSYVRSVDHTLQFTMRLDNEVISQLGKGYTLTVKEHGDG